MDLLVLRISHGLKSQPGLWDVETIPVTFVFIFLVINIHMLLRRDDEAPVDLHEEIASLLSRVVARHMEPSTLALVVLRIISQWLTETNIDLPLDCLRQQATDVQIALALLCVSPSKNHLTFELWRQKDQGFIKGCDTKISVSTDIYSTWQMGRFATNSKSPMFVHFRLRECLSVCGQYSMDLALCREILTAWSAWMEAHITLDSPVQCDILLCSLIEEYLLPLIVLTEGTKKPETGLWHNTKIQDIYSDAMVRLENAMVRLDTENPPQTVRALNSVTRLYTLVASCTRVNVKKRQPLSSLERSLRQQARALRSRLPQKLNKRSDANSPLGPAPVCGTESNTIMMSKKFRNHLQLILRLAYQMFGTINCQSPTPDRYVFERPPTMAGRLRLRTRRSVFNGYLRSLQRAFGIVSEQTRDYLKSRVYGLCKETRPWEWEILGLLNLCRFLIDEKIHEMPTLLIIRTILEWNKAKSEPKSLKLMTMVVETSLQLLTFSDSDLKATRILRALYDDLQTLELSSGQYPNILSSLQILKSLTRQSFRKYPSLWTDEDIQKALGSTNTMEAKVDLLFDLITITQQRETTKTEIERELCNRLESLIDHHTKIYRTEYIPADPFGLIRSVLTQNDEWLRGYFDLLTPLLYLDPLNYERAKLRSRLFTKLTTLWIDSFLKGAEWIVTFLSLFRSNIILHLYTHPKASVALKWLLVCIEMTLKCVNIPASKTSVQSAVPNELMPIASIGLIECGLARKGKVVEDEPNDQLPQTDLRLLRSIEQLMIDLTDILQKRQKRASLAADVNRSLNRIRSLCLQSQSTHSKGLSYPDPKLASSFCPLSIICTVIPRNFLSNYSLAYPTIEFDRLSISLRVAICTQRVISEGEGKHETVHTQTETFSLPGSRRMKKRPRRSTGSFFFEPLRPVPCVHRSDAYICSMAFFIHQLIITLLNLSSCCTQMRPIRLADGNEREVLRRWHEKEEFVERLVHVLQVCKVTVTMVSRLTGDMIHGPYGTDTSDFGGTAHANRRITKNMMANAISHLIESTRDLYCLVPQALTESSPSRCRSSRCRRNVWSVSHKDPWKKYLTKNVSNWLLEELAVEVDGGITSSAVGKFHHHTTSEILIDGFILKFPSDWHEKRTHRLMTTRPISDNLSEAHHSTVSRFQLLWLSLLNLKTDILMTYSPVMKLTQYIQQDFMMTEYHNNLGMRISETLPSSSLKKKAQLLLGRSKTQSQRYRLWPIAMDLLSIPAVSPSHMLSDFLSITKRKQNTILLSILTSKYLQCADINHITFFLPQLITSMRNDPFSLGETYIRAKTDVTDIFVKSVTSGVSTEIATLESLQRKLPQNAPFDIPASIGTLGRLLESILSSLVVDGRRRLLVNELTFFTELLDLSGQAIFLPMERRTDFLKHEISKVCKDHSFSVSVGSSGIQFHNPFGPHKLLACNVDRCKALKSAAKAPYMMEFETDHLLVAESPNHESDRPLHKSVSLIFKTNDDLRMDQIALQLIQVAESILKMSGLPLWLCPYGVESTFRHGSFGGLIEMIPNTKSRHEIGKDFGVTLNEYFRTLDNFSNVQWNFLRSLAAYSIVSFIIQFKDRHNANMLISDEGYLIHIDFGFILDFSPAGDFRFERAPFKLTQEMVVLLNMESTGEFINGAGFNLLRSLIVEGYLALRKEHKLIRDILKFYQNSGLPCYKRKTLKNLAKRLQLDRTDQQARSFMMRQVDGAVNALSTRIYDAVQSIQQGIAY